MGVNSACSVAMIGAGYMASEHIKAFNSIENVQISGIYNRNYERAAQLASEFHINYTARSISELYQATKADLVVVAVSEIALPLIIDEIFQFPWVVLFEKPVGLDLTQAQDFYERAHKTNTRAIVALNRRFYGATQTVMDHLNCLDGKRYIQVNDFQSLEQAQSLNYPEEVQKGLMFANSIHLIDYFNFLGRGNIETVNVIQRWDASKPLIAHLTYDSGDEGLYQGIWYGPGPWAISIVTPSHYFELKPLEVANFRTKNERKLQASPVSMDDQAYKPGLKQQAFHAVQFTLGLESQSVTLAESLKTMKLIDQIYAK